MSGSIILRLAKKYALPTQVVACYLDAARQKQVDGEAGYWGQWGIDQVAILLPRGPGGPNWADFVCEARELNRWPEATPERSVQQQVVDALTQAESAFETVANVKNLTHLSLIASRHAGGSWTVRSSWEVS